MDFPDQLDKDRVGMHSFPWMHSKHQPLPCPEGTSVTKGSEQVLSAPAVLWTCQAPEQGCEGHQQSSLLELPFHSSGSSVQRALFE